MLLHLFVKLLKQTPNKKTHIFYIHIHLLHNFRMLSVGYRNSIIIALNQTHINEAAVYFQPTELSAFAALHQSLAFIAINQ